ncbi:hypothetical protein A0H81_11844 [Grifola frondosa]|uniref:RlpA-like protein double-psi beta-barrel domain-containing protein n=1 Tax=Grifola frondosa TaxID=5627 RepID=A0A1C7LZI3_GRIFR|nr:hypothetical protein A0H81_11844 [Grifola frondosa]
MVYLPVFATLLSTILCSVNAYSGNATWYQSSVGGCSVNDSNPEDFLVALGPSEYNGGASCSGLVRIDYDGKSVVATVNDLCPTCPPGNIDLSATAFEELAELSEFLISVTWDFV